MLKNIESLDLTANRLSNLSGLKQFLDKNTSVQKLILRKNACGDEFVDYLVSEMTSPIRIFLGSNNISGPKSRDYKGYLIKSDPFRSCPSDPEEFDAFLSRELLYDTSMATLPDPDPKALIPNPFKLNDPSSDDKGHGSDSEIKLQAKF